jgi:hypothetical protein
LKRKKKKKDQNMKNIQVNFFLTFKKCVCGHIFPLVADSEEETGPRLKPVFVSKRDRITIAEKEKELQKQKQLELEAKKLAEEKRRQTLKVS